MVIGASRVARRGELLRLAIAAPRLAEPGPRQAILAAVDIALRHGAEPAVYSRPRRPTGITAA